MTAAYPSARKALGQHFLFDPDILRRTALAAGPVHGRTVIEVGPGPGGLTRALLDAGAARVIAVEADARFAATLETWPEAHGGRLHIERGDARRADWPGLVERIGGTVPAMIVANLPYNVATPLFVSWLKAGDWRGEMALMVQKEVGERIVAEAGSAHYGRLAVLTRAVAAAQIAFTLPPGAFRPPPRVDSAVIVVRPLAEASRYRRLDLLEKVTAAAFGQRRKMLRGALRSLARSAGLDAVAWLAACDIDPEARAETLTPQAFQDLADRLATG